MKRLFINTLLILFWIVLAITLAISATLICTVKQLHPDRLTPLVEKIVNNSVEARVNIHRAELSFRPAFPILHLHIDSLSILSDAFATLPADQRAELPTYADSLFRFDSFDGAIDLGALLRGEIGLKNIELSRPAANIVFAQNGRSNFEIYASTDTSATVENSDTSIPAISLSRFAILKPDKIRYYNAADSTEATVLLLDDAELDGSANPRYRLNIDGNISQPLLKGLLADSTLHFALDGKIRWTPKQADALALENFSISTACLNATVDTEISYGDNLVVSTGNIAIAPVSITEAISLLPEKMRKEYGLTHLKTDAAIALNAKLTRPFATDTDSIPYADIDITVANCAAKFGRVDLRRLALDMQLQLRGNNLDSTKVILRHFDAAGPATAITLSADVRNIISDPAFNASIDADMHLNRLPTQLTKLINGAASGRIKANMTASGALSMFDTNNFHKLDVHGAFRAYKLHYQSYDSISVADLDGVDIKFGSQVMLRTDSTKTAPTLAAKIYADTADIYYDGVSVHAGKFLLGANVENAKRSSDTTNIVPIGGGLSIGRLNIKLPSDSAGISMRDLKGYVSLKRFNNNSHEPILNGALDIYRLAAGNSSSRFTLTNSHFDLTMCRRQSAIKMRQEMKHLTDSISRRNPHLSRDSVFTLALENRQKNMRRRGIRQNASSDNEMLQWELSGESRRFLSEWQIEGSMTTKHARLFTPLFPLRNRINRLDLTFSTDSIVLNNVNYHAGHSDLNLRGTLSNLRRALISRRNNTLKIDLNLRSDTIDINQLAAATFAGAAYAERLRNSGDVIDLASADDDNKLEEQLDSIASEQNDSVGPLLIPVNIDATIDVAANTVLYSDLALDNLRGQMLVYDGGLNLRDLAATSDAGNVKFSALYSAPRVTDMHFGFGLDLERFRIERFLNLMPAIDSIMPLMRDFSGIIDADIAATVAIDSAMNMVLPTLDAAVRLTGDSLAFIDKETYKTMGKWLRFRDKADNKIKHMNVELLVRDNQMQIFPFEFEIDRYRLGVAGSNDLDMNFKYHVAVLKSPLPFKFGINITGNPDDYKVRLGGAKFKDGIAAQSINIVDTARVNLIQQIEGVFRRGVRNSSLSRLKVNDKGLPTIDLNSNENLTHADSVAFIREGLISAPAPADSTAATATSNTPEQSPADDPKRRR